MTELTLKSRLQNRRVIENQNKQQFSALLQFTTARGQLEQDTVYVHPRVHFEQSTQLTLKYLERCLAGWQIYNSQSRDYWEILMSKKLEASTDDLIDISHLNRMVHFKLQQLLFCEVETTLDPETELELEVAKHFKDVAEVQLICTDKYLGLKRFIIFTSNEQYNDELLDQMLTIEQNLRLSSTTIAASFVYIPKLIKSPYDVINKDSKVIYERDHNVSLASSSSASSAEREIIKTVT